MVPNTNEYEHTVSLKPPECGSVKAKKLANEEYQLEDRRLSVADKRPFLRDGRRSEWFDISLVSELSPLFHQSLLRCR
jgi:hypothetical protein